MNPIRWLFANNWPLRIWLSLSVAAAVWYLWYAVAPDRGIFTEWRQFLGFAGLAGACLIVALLAGMLGAAIVLSPFYRFQAALNGAPFRVGDDVRILVGKNKGRVTRLLTVASRISPC